MSRATERLEQPFVDIPDCATVCCRERPPPSGSSRASVFSPRGDSLRVNRKLTDLLFDRGVLRELHARFALPNDSVRDAVDGCDRDPGPLIGVTEELQAAGEVLTKGPDEGREENAFSRASQRPR